MDAIAMLKADHKKVKDLFRAFESTAERNHQKKKQIADEVFKELEVHSKLEEEIFYPAVQAKATKAGNEIVLEGFEEHRVVKTLITELQALSPDDERFDAKFKVLTENVEHHIEEEEKEMLPDARKRLGKEIGRITTEMEQLKEQLMAARV